MATKLLIRRGLKAEIETLAVGEIAYCTDTNEFFIGDTEGNILLNHAQHGVTNFSFSLSSGEQQDIRIQDDVNSKFYSGSFWAGVNSGDGRLCKVEIRNLNDTVKDYWEKEVFQIFWGFDTTANKLYVAVGFRDGSNLAWDLKFYNETESANIEKLRVISINGANVRVVGTQYDDIVSHAPID
jgi:hypothetical protein